MYQLFMDHRKTGGHLTITNRKTDIPKVKAGFSFFAGDGGQEVGRKEKFRFIITKQDIFYKKEKKHITHKA